MVYNVFKKSIDCVSSYTPNYLIPQTIKKLSGGRIGTDTTAEFYLATRVALAFLAASLFFENLIIAYLLIFIQISAFIYLLRIISPINGIALKDPERSLFFAFGHYIELGFSMAYVYRTIGSFSENVSSIDSIYFSFVTMTTLGYGDITPASVLTKMLVVTHLIAALFLFAVVVGVFLSLSSSKKDLNHDDKR